MGILVNRDTKVLVQGITGRDGSFHTERMLQYGTKVVAGVVPGKGGQSITLGTFPPIPIFNLVEEAVEATGADASVIFVPKQFAPDAITEALYAGMEVVVAITEGIPINDMVRVYASLQNTMATLIGPNCPGIVTVDECKLGIMPGHIFERGPVGVISRSGTLTYEVVAALTQAHLGQTTCIGIGGDPVIGSTFLDLLLEFENDEETKAIVLIGEIGGSDEEEAAEFIQEMSKPVVAFITGRNAPPGKRMGHAGAIISGGKGTAESKISAFQQAGVPVADTIQDIVRLTQERLAQKP